MAIATSFGVLNYSGMLFNKGNTRTPISAMIGGKTQTTDHVEFAVGQEYNTDVAEMAQPAISETASLTAPDATSVVREQHTNVTQIFHKSVGVSYAKQSNMGTLSGLNVANQQANPMSELDFQVAAKMQELNNEIEFTFINGVYQKATADNVANKTRGLVAAIGATGESDHNIQLGNKPITLWDIADALKVIQEDNAPVEGLILGVDATTLLQINADAMANGLTIVPNSREVNGIAISEVVTPMGTVGIRTLQYLPAGTALLLNMDVIAPVIQPVPGKGNFFLEELSKTGAGEKYQLFGQIGLNYGPSWYHSKITGIATTFTRPGASA